MDDSYENTLRKMVVSAKALTTHGQTRRNLFWRDLLESKVHVNPLGLLASLDDHIP